MHSRSVIMGIFLANRDAPSRCTATDCLVNVYAPDYCTGVYNVYS